MSLDGLLVIDKSSGPTSHDVVETARRVLHERRIGHTGTLDPLATGVLPLVLGRATRLARFLTAHDKEYIATIQLGIATDTGDSQGQPIGERYRGAYPCDESIELALSNFRGTFMQQPPAFSAKKVNGQRSYRVARSHSREVRDLPADPAPPPLPAPVSVTVSALGLLGTEGDTVTLRLTCSAGFYVRALACDLGVALGTGAHLTALRRVRVGAIGLDRALPYSELVMAEGAGRALAAILPMEAMLPELPAVHLTPEGATRVVHGRDVSPADASGALPAALLAPDGPAHYSRLLGPDGALLAIAETAATPGFLHPAVVLV